MDSVQQADDETKAMNFESFAKAVEFRFISSPHVGVVRHFEGLDLPGFVRTFARLMDDLGLRPERAVEDVKGKEVFNAVAKILVGEGMDLWIWAAEEQAVGVKVEMRLFHALEESAQADEHLAKFAQVLADRIVER